MSTWDQLWNKLAETEALLQLANGRCNVLAKQLGDEQKKLEAIRGTVEYEDVTECIEKIQHILDDGVLKEMQEKEQQ